MKSEAANRHVSQIQNFFICSLISLKFSESELAKVYVEIMLRTATARILNFFFYFFAI